MTSPIDDLIRSTYADPPMSFGIQMSLEVPSDVDAPKRREAYQVWAPLGGTLTMGARSASEKERHQLTITIHSPFGAPVRLTQPIGVDDLGYIDIFVEPDPS